MTWNIKETRELLKQRYGVDQLRTAQDALRGVTTRLDHARYHYQEIRGLLKQHIDDQLPERHIMEITLPGSAGLSEALTKVEAHMVACAQAIHSIADGLAHVAFYAAGLNLSAKPLDARRVNVSNVLDLLERDPRFSEVAGILSTLKSAPAYVAIDETVNYGKHRGLPDPVLQLEPEDHDAPYAMQFPSFRYGETPRPEVEVERLLGPAYELMSRSVVNAGKAINKALAHDV